MTNDLVFIGDVELREKIEQAIETISELYLLQQQSFLKKELRRTMILYAASVIEAVLLYLYKQQNSSALKTEYKDVYPLPKSYQKDNAYTFVVAKQFDTVRSDRELQLDTLLNLFRKQGHISKSLALKIEKAKNLRNTFHLSKSRRGINPTEETVKAANDAMFEVITTARQLLAD